MQTLEIYDPKIKESISSKSYTVNGTKIFEYLIIPRGGGTFKLPDLTFSHFDPQKEQYVSKTEEGPEIFVEGEAIDQQHYQSNSINKEEVELLSTDIRYIKTCISGDALSGTHLLTRPVFHLLTWLPVFMALFLPFFYSRRRKMENDTDLLRSKKAHKLAGKRMASARKLMHNGDDKAFYNEVIKAFWSYIEERFSIPIADLSKEQLSLLFDEKSIDPQLTAESLKLINSCEMAIYAPMAVNDSKEAIVAKASGLIQQIEKSSVVK